MAEQEEVPPAGAKVVEITADELMRRLNQDHNGKDTQKIMRSINIFDQNRGGFRERQLAQETYAQRGINVQQHDIMAGFTKWMGTMFQMSYNLILNISISQGGIAAAVKAMKKKTWLDRNGWWAVPSLIAFGMYLTFVYDPPFQALVVSALSSVYNQIVLVIVVLAILVILTRTGLRKRNEI